MEICVAGWYFDGDFLQILDKASEEHEVTIISHRDAREEDIPFILKFSFVYIENVGLEFGAYDFYLKHCWKGGKVLFLHDDVKISSPEVFNEISKIEKDCAYIFRDKYEEKANGGKHGRAFVASSRFLEFVRDFECDCSWNEEKHDPHNPGTILPKLKAHKGFWYDPHNKGHISGKPPVGVRHYNEGIYHFHWFLGRIRDRRCGHKRFWPNPKIKMDVVNRIFMDDFIPGRRNCWKHIEREINRYGEIS